MKRTVDWWYVYRMDATQQHYFYDRTCGTEEAADRWVKEWQGRGRKAVAVKNHLIKGAFY